MSSLPTELQCLAERAQGETCQVIGTVRHLPFWLHEQGADGDGSQGADLAVTSACDELLLLARTLQFDAARMRELIDEQAEADRELYSMTTQLVDLCRFALSRATQDKPPADALLATVLAENVQELVADMQELLAERFPGESASIGG